MLREALRRLLWLGPTLLVVTVPTFWITAELEANADHPEAAPAPLFFNENPSGASERAVDAARRAARGDLDGARELSHLGGAGLPHVLPLLDALAPDARARVAVALAPVGRRMGIAATRDLDSPEAAVLFWTRYWDEHAIDFRPSVVRRTVRRFAEHPSALRRAEVIELDTSAVPDLVEAMRPLSTPDDVARVREVCAVAAHVTERPWTVPEGATLRETRTVVGHWERYFQMAQSDFVALAGAKRLAATLLDTRYGRWASQLGRRELGVTRDGRSVAVILRFRAPVTLLLVGGALFGGYPLGLLLATWAFARRRSLGGRATALAVALLASATPLGIASICHGPGRPVAWGVAGMALVGTAAGAFHVLGLLRRSSESVHVRTALSFGAGPTRALFRELRAMVPSLAASAVSSLPGLLTASFVLERALSLRGLGEPAVRAILTGDPALLMALAFSSALALGVLQILADLLHAALDPRLPLGTKSTGGAP